MATIALNIAERNLSVAPQLGAGYVTMALAEVAAAKAELEKVSKQADAPGVLPPIEQVRQTIAQRDADGEKHIKNALRLAAEEAELHAADLSALDERIVELQQRRQLLVTDYAQAQGEWAVRRERNTQQHAQIRAYLDDRLRNAILESQSGLVALPVSSEALDIDLVPTLDVVFGKAAPPREATMDEVIGFQQEPTNEQKATRAKHVEDAARAASDATDSGTAAVLAAVVGQAATASTLPIAPSDEGYPAAFGRAMHIGLYDLPSSDDFDLVHLEALQKLWWVFDQMAAHAQATGKEVCTNFETMGADIGLLKMLIGASNWPKAFPKDFGPEDIVPRALVFLLNAQVSRLAAIAVGAKDHMTLRDEAAAAMGHKPY